MVWPSGANRAAWIVPLPKVICWKEGGVVRAKRRPTATPPANAAVRPAATSTAESHRLFGRARRPPSRRTPPPRRALRTSAPARRGRRGPGRASRRTLLRILLETTLDDPAERRRHGGVELPDRPGVLADDGRQGLGLRSALEGALARRHLVRIEPIENWSVRQLSGRRWPAPATCTDVPSVPA